jgi:hypothetical protein
MPEFGNDDQTTVAPTPFPFVGSASGTEVASVILGPVPPGETWILQGADFYGQTGDDGSVTMTVAAPAGFVTWANNVATTHGDEGLTQGGNYRGAMPFGRGTYVQASAFCGPDPVSTGVTVWGVILPFDLS